MSESTGKAVFLSYASQDADAALRVCEGLRADIGLTEAHARAQAWRKAHPPEKAAK